MGVKVNIHPLLYHVTDNVEEIDVNGNTVGECLEEMVIRFPAARKLLFGKDGKLLNFINVYVNGESTYPDELVRIVRDGDELHILAIVAGG